MARTKPKSKYYAVKKGRQPGIYKTWGECKSQTEKFSGAIFKSFSSFHEAKVFVGGSVAEAGCVVAAAAAANSAAASSAAAAVGVGSRNTKITSKSNKRARNAREIKRSDLVPGTSISHITTAAAVPEPSSTSSSAPSYRSVLKIQLWFDGASRGNPGIAGCGALLQVTTTTSSMSTGTNTDTNNNYNNTSTSGNKVWEEEKSIRHFCGYNATNNVAEYIGLLQGLQQVEKVVQEFCNNVRKQHQRNGDSDCIVDDESANTLAGGCATIIDLTTCDNANLSMNNDNNSSNNNNINATNTTRTHERNNNERDRHKIELIVHGDSMLVINQMNGIWSVKNTELRNLYSQCIQCIRNMERHVSQPSPSTSTVSKRKRKRHEYRRKERLSLESSLLSSGATATATAAAADIGGTEFVFTVNYGHVYRDKNTVADKLANEAVDEKRSWITCTETIEV